METTNTVGDKIEQSVIQMLVVFHRLLDDAWVDAY